MTTGLNRAVTALVESDRRFYAAMTAVLGLYLVLSIGLSFERPPICDEGWYASPTLSLLHSGDMGSPVLEGSGSYLKDIERYTYWIVPVHSLIQAPWFQLFGASLASTRLLSVVSGLAALLCWFYILQCLTGNRSVALLGLFLASIDSTFLILASTGRADMMSAAFGAAALASYLALRENHFLWALFAGHAFAVASGLTNPTGGLVAVPSLALLHFWFDRRRMRWSHLLVISSPYIIAVAAWASYILQDPQAFRAQFGGNSVGRLWPLGAPLLALHREVTDRFLPAYGVMPQSQRLAGLRMIVLVIYTAAAVGLLWPRRVRELPAARIIISLIAIVLFVLFFLEGAKQPWYLIHLVWLLAAAVAVSYKGHTGPHPSWRPLGLATIALLILIDTGYAASLIVQRKYDMFYRPAIAALRRELRPGQLVMGSAELGFGLGFDQVLDDKNLGYYSGKTAGFIALDANYRAHLAELERTRPEVYGALRNMLAEKYQPIYANAMYAIYERR